MPYKIIYLIKKQWNKLHQSTNNSKKETVIAELVKLYLR
jgi:hypothetical protein